MFHFNYDTYIPGNIFHSCRRNRIHHNPHCPCNMFALLLIAVGIFFDINFCIYFLLYLLL